VAKWLTGSGCHLGSVGRRMGVLDGAGYRRKTVLGLNLGRPIVTNGTLLRCCAEVCEPIELSFGMGPSIDVRNEGPRAARGRGGS